jgi:hypothetical protein
MKYNVKDIEGYRTVLDTVWNHSSKRGEKVVHLSLTGNTLKVTSIGGGAILHGTIEVSGVEDGNVWVDGAHLTKVSQLLPLGRELAVTSKQALTYQVKGFTSQDIPLAATHPSIPVLGDSVQLFSGVDLSSLALKDVRSLALLAISDYNISLYSQVQGALVKTSIPTAHPCPNPVALEVSGQCIALMKKMEDTRITYWSSSYIGFSDAGMELLLPVSTPPNNKATLDAVIDSPTSYCIRVHHADLENAIKWVTINPTTSIMISYTDPCPYIEVRPTSSISKAPTTVAFTQDEVDEEVLSIAECKYAPSTLLSALSFTPRGSITLSGRSFSVGGIDIPGLLISADGNGASTTYVFVNGLV